MKWSSNLKKFRSVLAVGAVLAASLGVTLPVKAQTVEEIKKKGQLTVGMLVDFPPFGITNLEGQPDGFDADIAKALAKHLGVKANIVPVTGPNRIPFLLTGKVDMLVASLAITPERAKQVAFSDPYAGIRIVVYGKKNAAVRAPADLKNVSVGVARASTQDVSLTAIAPEGTQIRRFDDDASAVQALLSGQVDVIGAATPVVGEIEKVAPGQFDTKLTLREQVHGIALRPGQDELLKTVNEFVAEQQKNGALAATYKKWVGADLPELKKP
ncbi:transporter substrate-binding domain-containing protein [Microvirga calopogonii]|uniref:transporter substrate-binding domain-containing protein n=1 Tax=Microvirga calopogonii TaxID=2078013 RepID=UPI000E0DAA33|nr:transporter substrate-binding domain-containing protein [Microvirga calopogonii]